APSRAFGLALPAMPAAPARDLLAARLVRDRATGMRELAVPPPPSESFAAGPRRGPVPVDGGAGRRALVRRRRMRVARVERPRAPTSLRFHIARQCGRPRCGTSCNRYPPICPRRRRREHSLRSNCRDWQLIRKDDAWVKVDRE